MANPLDAIHIKTIYSVYMLNFIHGGKIYCAIDHVGNTEWEICRSMIERRNIT